MRRIQCWIETWWIFQFCFEQFPTGNLLIQSSSLLCASNYMSDDPSKTPPLALLFSALSIGEVANRTLFNSQSTSHWTLESRSLSPSPSPLGVPKLHNVHYITLATSSILDQPASSFDSPPKQSRKSEPVVRRWLDLWWTDWYWGIDEGGDWNLRCRWGGHQGFEAGKWGTAQQLWYSRRSLEDFWRREGHPVLLQRRRQCVAS